jgi:hypothetical protein
VPHTSRAVPRRATAAPLLPVQQQYPISPACTQRASQTNRRQPRSLSASPARAQAAGCTCDNHEHTMNRQPKHAANRSKTQPARATRRGRPLLFSELLAQGRVTVAARVLVVVLKDGFDHGIFDKLWRGPVGEALAQVYSSHRHGEGRKLLPDGGLVPERGKTRGKSGHSPHGI